MLEEVLTPKHKNITVSGIIMSNIMNKLTIQSVINTRINNFNKLIKDSIKYPINKKLVIKIRANKINMISKEVRMFSKVIIMFSKIHC